MKFLITAAVALLTIAITTTAQAFCGFYVARADTSLFNKASQVVLVRDDDRTVITMANDFQGDVKDFAVIVPVPTFIERGQINVADGALIAHLDATPHRDSLNITIRTPAPAMNLRVWR